MSQQPQEAAPGNGAAHAAGASSTSTSSKPDPKSPPDQPPPSHSAHGAAPTGGRLVAVALAALGIVYGDIGTSPLYAVNECFLGTHSVDPSRLNVLGVMSLFFWSIIMVVTVKYLGFIMKADNRGEGGIFALVALIPTKLDEQSSKLKVVVVLMGLFGASLLYGDGIITPAISVLGAIEGLAANPTTGAPTALSHLVVPLTCAILIALFAVQKRGTGGIGPIFGPVMLVWFTAIGVLGVRYVFRQPGILEAVNPVFAVQFFLEHGVRSIAVLGSVVLCITGAEALYADMGHFGARPIRLGWYIVVLPALMANYFGQGALLLEQGKVANAFYGLVPEALLYPMVALATAAAVIASQALISGAFSLTRQAVQLGYFPRVNIVHTSEKTEGQIYIPEVNRFMAVACVLIVLVFQKSSALAAAYGIAVTGTMAVTSVAFYFVVTRAWGWRFIKAAPLVLLFLAFDVSFFGANLLKFLDGGWFPIAVGVFIFALMTTWQRGRREMGLRFAAQSMPLDALLEDLRANQPHRVRGTAVFMAGSPDGTPPVLLHHLKHNQVLHRQVVLLSVVNEPVPSVEGPDAIDVEEKEQGFYRVIARTGFMQTPNVPAILRACRERGLVCEPSTTSYYLGRETLLTTGKSKMMRWRKALFAIVSRNARSATAYFGIPPGRVVELGMQVDL